MTDAAIHRFDVAALYSALDARRAELGLSWKQVADQLRPGCLRYGSWEPGRPAAATGSARDRWLTAHSS